MVVEDGSVPEWRLCTVEGPRPIEFDLVAPGPVTIGRRSTHDLALIDEDLVSRDHAVLVQRMVTGGIEWRIIDTQSKHGTFVNDEHLNADQEYPLVEGDRVRIAPWTFEVRRSGDDDTTAGGTTRMMPTPAEADAASIETLDSSASRELARERLSLLLRCADRIHQATDVTRLAELVVDAAMSGAGFANAAMLGPMHRDGSVEVFAHRGDIVDTDQRLRVSRSLIRRAADGAPVRMGSPQEFTDTTVSVADYGIRQVVCVPLMLGETPAAYLYLDNRSSDPRESTIASDAAEFALGLGRIAGMAMANLRRLDLERRHAAVQAELTAAAEIQRSVLPPRGGSAPGLTYVGECRQGRLLGGDFFDVITLDDTRTALTVGDVSGKGIPAAVLMTEAQGFLHAALQHASPGDAVAELNRFLEPRRPEGRFVTLWVGVVDAATRRLTFVNAGHGYAFHMRGDTVANLDEKGGLPIAIDPNATYTTHEVDLTPGDRIIVVSDGAIEQRGVHTVPGSPDFFGVAGVQGAARAADDPGDVVRRVFDALEAHAGGSALADDATVLAADFEGSGDLP